MKNRIRELREELHMTQIRLSLELEVAQETVSAYENEKHYPSFVQLVKMSELFHASIDYIMGRSDVRNPIMLKESNGHDRLTNLTRQLSAQQVDLVIAYVQGMLDAVARHDKTD